MQNLRPIIPGFDGPNGLSLNFGGSNEVDNDRVERRLVFVYAIDFGNLVYILETVHLFILMPSGSAESILYVFVEGAWS